MFLKPILHEKAFGQSLFTEYLKTANVNLRNERGGGGGGQVKQLRVTRAPALLWKAGNHI